MKNLLLSVAFFTVLAWIPSQAQILTTITGGDPGEGFNPLAINVQSVDFQAAASSTTVQGITFVKGNPSVNAGGGYSSNISASGFGFGSSPTTNDTNLASILQGFNYVGSNTVYNYTTSTPYDQYVFTGLTAGQNYQLDVLTVTDSNPRDTNIQVIGGTTFQNTVLTNTTPTDVSYTLTADASGDITLDWGFGGDPANNSGNAGLVSGAALTMAVPEPSTVWMIGLGALFLWGVRRLKLTPC